MADAAVRVDIIVGQNSVVPAVERTSATLQGAQRSAAGLNTGFENLSSRGMRKVENGFQNIAARAVGLQGPWSKVVEGMLLLGAGSTVVLGLAAGTALIAKGIELVGRKSKEAEESLKKATTALTEFLNPKNPLQGSIDAVSTQISVLQMRMLSTFDPKLLAQYNAEMVRLQKLLADVAAKQAPAPPKPAGTKAGRAGDLDYRVAVGLTGGPQIAALDESVIALRETLIAPLEEMPEQVAAAFAGINQEYLTGLSITQDFIDALNATLLWGIVDLGTALAEALGSGQSIGKVLVSALGQMMQQIGKLLIEFGVALVGLRPLLSNLFTSGPAMIAAGVLIAAAGAAVSKAATGGQVSSRAATGGVDRGQYQNDQQAMAARGTVTVSMKGGFIDPRSPDFQEFLAQVIKEAKGRNVVFA